MRIDHVIYATADLGGAARVVERELGLTAVAGGRHEGLGTHNMIVALAGAYLELLAVADDDEAAGSVSGRALLAHLGERGDGLFAWAVAVDDVAPVAERLGTSVMRVTRGEFGASLTGVEQALREPFLPFFVARDAGSPDPTARTGAPELSWLEVGGDRRRLEDWLGGTPPGVRILDGPAAVLAVGVGARELRPAPH
jgi:hypothetical protein